MKRKQQAQKLALKKATITSLNAGVLNEIIGGLTVGGAGGCVQPTTTVQHTYALCQTARICPTTYTFNCTD